MAIEKDKLTQIFIESSTEQLASLEEQLLDLEHLPKQRLADAVAPIFRVAHSIKGDSASMSFHGISELCHGLENVLQQIKDFELQPTATVISELLFGFDLVRTLVNECSERGNEDMGEYLLRLRQACNKEKDAQRENEKSRGPEPETASPVPKEEPGEKAGEELKDSMARKGGLDASGQISRLNIPASELDILVDRIGELAIAQVRLSRLALDLDAEHFLPVSEEIERLSNLLRNQVLEMRMLPLQVSFAKYRRMVWELASSMGKDAELVMVGENTELDKTVIEQLNTPLIHLLRNAIHHGIESPEVREQSGKPAKGTITLSARQDGNEVVLALSDDGAGIDIDAVYQKALEQKKVDPADELTQQEKLELIFLPGLSTSKKLDSVSGRGVGMDAVKDTVNALRGNLALSSVPGKGCVFTIRMPISMAIVDCLRVLVDGESYFFHLDYVEGCLELPLTLEEMESGIRTFWYREAILPVICLRDFFQIPGAIPKLSQVVVIDVPAGKFGVVVDEVLGQQQAVLKQLGPALEHLEAVLGATVTDDGVMALILDATSLARTALAESCEQDGSTCRLADTDSGQQ